MRLPLSAALPFLLLAGLGLALAACGNAPGAAPDATAPTAPSSVTDITVKPVAAVLRVPDLGKLSGMSASDLISLIGKPDFRRVEPPAELWQYRSADCVLDIFLYGDGPSYRVIHAEARDRDPTGATHRCTDGANALHDRGQQSRLHDTIQKPVKWPHRSHLPGWA